MRADCTEFPADVLLTKVTRGTRVLIYASVRDITERKRADQQIARMAHYDNLTGLVNRLVFVETLERRIARAQRDDNSFAVLYLDLDHFKDVNDTLGHPVGDALLRTVAKRLQANVRAADTVARFGGDEFAILLNDITEPGERGFCLGSNSSGSQSANQHSGVMSRQSPPAFRKRSSPPWPSRP